MMKYLQTLFFDLDGTLIDTAPDLAHSLNLLLEKYNKPPLPYREVRPICSNGCKGLLKIGFDITEGDDDYSRLREEYLAIYHSHMTEHSILFDGIEKTITYLDNNNIAWGIITNKPYNLAQQIVAKFPKLNGHRCLLGGDSVANKKPHPEALYKACEMLGVKPNECVYIGDSSRDIVAAKKANMVSIAVTYGYIPPDTFPHLWGADHMIDQPIEIIDWVESMILKTPLNIDPSESET